MDKDAREGKYVPLHECTPIIAGALCLCAWYARALEASCTCQSKGVPRAGGCKGKAAFPGLKTHFHVNMQMSVRSDLVSLFA